MGGAMDDRIDDTATSARPLDLATREALSDHVEAAKARGWTQDDLRAFFERLGVGLSEYLAARRGEAVRRDVAAALAQVSITALPERPIGAPEADDYAEIPAQMKAARRWLLWRSETDPDRPKPRKTPYYANGQRRHGALDSVEDVARLATFDEAIAALTPDHAGLGFALGPDEAGGYWQGIDLDELESHPGLVFIADDLPGYTEKSPSGKGVHAIGYGREFRSLGSNATGIEAYARGRFFTVTGEAVGFGEIACLADFVERRLAPLHSPRPQDTSARVEEGAGSIAGALAVRDLRSALAHMRSDDRDLWIRMGHALKTLGDQGRGLWLEWSQTSAKYDAADAAATWDSFKPTHTGYQAVFAEAQRQGWVNPAAAGQVVVQPATREVIDPETGEILEEATPQDVSRPFRASEFTGEPPPRAWIVRDWIVEGAVNSLYGDGGVGKTLLAQQLACAVSMGAPWLGLETRKGSVLAVLCEDEQDELHRRHNDIKAAMGHAVGNPFDDVWLWPRVGEANTLLRFNRDGQAVLGGFYARVVEMVEELEPSLLILDTLADVYGGNEIDRPQVNYFVKTVLGGLIKHQAEKGRSLTILLLGHPSVAGKASGAGYSGSTAWNNAVRSRMYLTKPEDGPSDERILTRGKANYASSGDETAIRLIFTNGTLSAGNEVEDGDTMLWSAKEEVVRIVDRAWRDGRPFAAKKGHPRYVYTAIDSDVKRAGIAPQLARQAIRELIEEEVIYVGRDNAKRGYRSAKSG